MRMGRFAGLAIVTLLAGPAAAQQLTPAACDPRPSDTPPWLRAARPLHWVGGLFAPGSLPSEAFRPFTLVNDFDGILYLPRVIADQLFDEGRSSHPAPGDDAARNKARGSAVISCTPCRPSSDTFALATTTTIPRERGTCGSIM